LLPFLGCWPLNCFQVILGERENKLHYKFKLLLEEISLFLGSSLVNYHAALFHFELLFIFNNLLNNPQATVEILILTNVVFDEA
jgi:hypothetical protein